MDEERSAEPITERLERLEARVARLERGEPAARTGEATGAATAATAATAGAAGASPATGPAGPVAAPPADTADTGGDVAEAGPFWALDGLKRRAADPGAVLFAGTVTLPTGEHYEWQLGHGADDLLGDDWTRLSGAFAALAHPVRLLLLREILGGARTAAQLSAHEELGTTGQLYHHLRQLVAAGWLRASARGRYAVPGERVVPLLVALMAARR